MARGFTIRETDVYQLIINELNNNAFSSKIEFSMADWIALGQDADGNPEGLLINKLVLSKGDISRPDIAETFDEETYAKQENPFVAFEVGPLNGEITALNDIKDIVYSPVLTFLVPIENINVQRAITLAIEEVRHRLIQYERIWNVEYPDIENITNATKIQEQLKVIITSGTIDYGGIIPISGKQYSTYTLPLTINITDFGEFMNQQKIYMGTYDILDSGSPKMFKLEPNEWHWGTSRGTESAMLIPDLADPTSTNNKEIKSITKNKGFAFTIDLQMDFYNDTNGEFLKWLYKDSILEKAEDPIMKLTIEFYKYDSATEDFIIDNDLTMTREMILTQNQPNDSMSKGDKLIHSLVLTPIYNNDN